MTADHVATQLNKLEREIARLRAVCVLGIVLALSVGFVGQTGRPSRVLQSERFEIIDSEGKAHGWFAASHDGSSALVLLRPEVQYPTESPAQVSFRDGALQGVAISIDTKGRELLTMSDKHGNCRVEIACATDGSPSVQIFGTSRGVGGGLAATTDGPPGLSLHEQGGCSLDLGIKRYFEPPNEPSRAELVIYNREGKPVFKTPWTE